MPENRVIPQSFIDDVSLQLDVLMQDVKTKEAQGGSLTVEQLALVMFDTRGMIDETTHRQVLSVMVAILIGRATF